MSLALRLPTSAAALVLTAKDGRTWKVETSAATGTPDNPMSDDALSEKFGDLVEPYLGRDTSNKVCRLALGANGYRAI